MKPTGKEQVSKATVAKRRQRNAIKAESLIRPWGRKGALALLNALSSTPASVLSDQTEPLDAPKRHADMKVKSVTKRKSTVEDSNLRQDAELSHGAPLFESRKSKAVTSLEVAAAFGRRQLLRQTIGEAEAALRYRVDREVTLGTIRKAVRDKRLVALRGENGELRFPTWQFRRRGGVVPGLREVITSLPPWIIKDDVGVVAFFLNPNPLTKSRSPIQALRSGRMEEVLLAALDARY